MTYTSIEICHDNCKRIEFIYELYEYLLKWSPHGVDYEWINPITIEIMVPDNIDIDEVLNDFYQIILTDYSNNKPTISIPYRLIKYFSISLDKQFGLE